MSQNTLLPDDPKVTAYALGELEGSERAAVEAALRENPAARAAVEEIRATAAQLTAALATESEPETTPAALASERHATIIGGRNRRQLDGDLLAHDRKKLIKFPQLYYIVGLAAAACFAVMVALRTPTPHPVAEKKEYLVFDLPPVAPAAKEPGSVAADMPSAIVVANEPKTVEEKSSSLLDQVKKENETLVGDALVAGVAPLEVQPDADTSIVSAPAAPVASVTSTVAARLTVPSTPPTVITGRVSNAATGRYLEGAEINIAGNRVATTDRSGAFKVEGAPAGKVDLSANYPGLDKQQDAVTVPASGTVTQDISLQSSDVLALDAYVVASSKERAAQPMVLMQMMSLSESRSRRLPFPPPGARFGADTETYAATTDNDFLGALQNPLSTFSIDTDTAGYANMRRFLQNGTLPPRDAVRIEEMLNYFSYNYAAPKDDKPFAASLEIASAPWAPNHRLVRIGLKGREVATADRPAANLVFLLDVSGSMNASNRLPLVKESMRLLVGKLRPDDRVAIVVYAGASGLALPSTPVSKAREILDALDELQAGGSTNGALGIQLAYDIAKANFVSEGINRVILCTDGDFNVGVTREGDLTRLIEEKAKSGVFLTVLGFGMGNLKDSTLEKLADKGNGNYGYIDTRSEAEKLLVEQVNGTLMTIAKDVKIQVEFNPAKVASYRLIGYENRLLRKEDFNNDKVDAGEIGAGHTVTALYEIVPVGAEEKSRSITPAVDDLKYQRPASASVAHTEAKETGTMTSNELLTVKIRYKKPDGLISRRIEFALVDTGAQFAGASRDFKFAAAVAGFGMILRESAHKGTATLSDVIAWAGGVSKEDEGGYRGEFIGLVNSAKALVR